MGVIVLFNKKKKKKNVDIFLKMKWYCQYKTKNHQ